MYITKHANRRRGRTGLKKKTIDKVKDLAYEKGLRRHDCHGRLRRYMDAIRCGRSNTNVRLYNNFVWIFADTALITVYNIPAEYQVQAAKLLRRKNGKEDTATPDRQDV